MSNPDEGNKSPKYVAGELSEPARLIIPILFGLIPFVGGVLVILYQAFQWMSYGVWPSISLIQGLQTTSTASWFTAPQSQFALHAVMNYIPLSLALAAFGALVLKVTDR
jgi:hypothetical protein